MTPDQDIDHAISAASLVLAVLAALYTLWLAEIGRALALEGEPDSTNRGPQKTQVVSALLTKGLPLAVTSVIAAGIMLPRSLLILKEALSHWSVWRFDDVKAMLVLTTALLLLLAVVSAAQAWRLLDKRLELGRK